MNKAIYIGTAPLEFINDSNTHWKAIATEDIIENNLIQRPPEHLFTLGSGIATWMNSLATTPAYPLPTQSQFYLAGRDVLRWGGPTDPHEIDIDHYGFTPDFNRGVAVMWKAPKSEPHHLSQLPEYIARIPSEWRDICRAIVEGELQ